MRPTCPHCGASLHDGASFCPRCARSAIPRTEIVPPRHMPRRVLYSALLIALAVVLIGAIVWYAVSRPRSYDGGTSDMVYSGQAGDYRLFLSDETAPDTPIPQVRHLGERDESHRYLIYLFASDVSGGANDEDFWRSVDSVTAEINASTVLVSVSCTEPVRESEYNPFPNAMMTIVEYKILSAGEHDAELVFTITMKNGDVIRLRQPQQYAAIITRTYTPQDASMDTIEELRALLDDITATTGENDLIYITLPAVTYQGGLDLDERCVKLTGSVGTDGRRTAFTGPVRAAYSWGYHEFTNIDFLGGGEGVGVSASVRTKMTNCRVSGWETGYQAVGEAWIDAFESTFENNGVGLHFNSGGGRVMDDIFPDNVFRNNGTAVLLESVPTDIMLKFTDTRFTGNGVDIDNRCNQALDVSGAVFE